MKIIQQISLNKKSVAIVLNQIIVTIKGYQNNVIFLIYNKI